LKILITGAGGFVGRRLVAAAATAGHDVIALLHSAPSEHDKKYFGSERVTVLEAELTTFDPAHLPAGIDAVIALAQSNHFREFPKHAMQVFDVNVAATLRLLDWCVTSGVRRFVLASSGGIYGGKRGVHFQETDGFAINSPLGFYLGSKLCSEIVLQAYRQFLDCAVVIRPFFIYGPAQRGDMFVTRIINSVRNGLPITLQGADGLKVNPIFVDDAASAFLGAVDLSGNWIINVAGPEILSLRILAEIIGQHLGASPVFQTVEGEPIDYVADIAIARKLLGLTPRGIESGLAEVLGRVKR
jgi:nucleoside-diphosphate-sugar epimerase